MAHLYAFLRLTFENVLHVEICPLFGFVTKGPWWRSLLEFIIQKNIAYNQFSSGWCFFGNGGWSVHGSAKSEYSVPVVSVNWLSILFTGMLAKKVQNALMPRGQEQSWFLGGTANSITEGCKTFWQQLVPRISVLLQCCHYLLVNSFPVQVYMFFKSVYC